MEEILPDLSITGFTTPDDQQSIDRALLPTELSVLASTQPMSTTDAIMQIRSIMFEGSNIDALSKMLTDYKFAPSVHT